MRIRSLALVVGLTLAGTTACTGGGSATTYDVKAGDDSCAVSDTDLASGKATFKVTNTGRDVTEVYVYGKEGDAFTKIVGEKENIGPGTSQSFTVDLAAGDYEVACKPGMKGDGIRTRITVTGGSDGSSESSESAYDKELEFEVGSDGAVTAPQGLTAAAGDRIEFKLGNETGQEYYLAVEDAAGTEVGKAAAQAGADGEFIAELPKAGTYRVRVYADGQEPAAQEFLLVVS